MDAAIPNEYSEEKEEEQMVDDGTPAEPTENLDKLNNYYKLKNKYEQNKDELKLAIIRDVTLNRRSKKETFLKILPKCVNCKRRVGTFFSTTYNSEDDSRTLLAICGNIRNPCKLNIELKLNAVYILNDIIKHEKQKMDENQFQIISMKNDLLFGYERNQDNTIIQFEIITNEIKKQTQIIETNLMKLLNVIKNPEKIQNIKQMQKDYYSYINDFKEIIRKYETSQEEHEKNEYIHSAYEYYRDTIHPTTILLANLKYSCIRVNADENDVYLLEQIPFTIKMLETTNDNDMITVIHYTVGGIIEQSNELSDQNIRMRNRTVDARNKYRQNQIKTRKSNKIQPQQQLRVVNILKSYNEALDFVQKCLQNKKINAPPMMLDKDNIASEAKNGPWSFDLDAAKRTLHYIFNVIYNTCYIFY